ncbi:hypothetical protein I204_01027 [Kwoniella mangroviensis CBS 8886]|nr:hypothetical protein I204_01027 [Kwoniella mangroviensis CBS 8886]
MADDVGKQLDKAGAGCVAWLATLNAAEHDYLLGELPGSHFEREPRLDDEDNLISIKSNWDTAKRVIDYYRENNQGGNALADSEGRHLRKRKTPAPTKPTKPKLTKLTIGKGKGKAAPIEIEQDELEETDPASPFHIGASSSSIITPSPHGGPKSPTKGKHILSFTSLEDTYNNAIIKWEQAQQREDHTWNIFEKPEIIPHSDYNKLGLQLEDQEYRNTYMWFQCKLCKLRYRHRVGESSGGTLSDHKSRCKGKQEAKNAIAHGTLINANTMTESKLLFMAVINTALHNRSFNSFNDLLSMAPILNPGGPESSPNHRSYLGIVISWLERIQGEHSNSPKAVQVRSTVLNFIHAEGASTGRSMADQISHSLAEVNLGQNLFAITLDNASANDVLVKRLGKDDSLPLFTGEDKRIRCFAHILNLVVKLLLMPFTPNATLTRLEQMVQRQAQTENRLQDNENDDDDGRDMFDDLEDEISEDEEQQDQEHHKEQEEWEQWCQNKDLLDSSAQYANDLLLIGETIREGMTETTIKSSLEGGASQLNTLVKQVKRADLKAAMQMLMKVRLLRYAGPQKFITRDVPTRWNSTGNMLRDVLDMKLVVKVFYAHPDILKDKINKKRFVLANRLNDDDYSFIQHLEKVLKFIKQATDYFQRETGQGEHPVTVAMVIPYIDQVTSLLDTLIANDTAPIVVRTGACIASNLMSSYYSKTDQSLIYRLAILLHPSMRMKHLKDQKWLQSWQDQAEKLLRDVYATYESDDQGPIAASSPAEYWGPTLSVPDDEDQLQEDPVGQFINGSRSTGKNCAFVDPLHFWHCKMEDNYANLRRLALDVFSTPGKWRDPQRLIFGKNEDADLPVIPELLTSWS